MFRNKFVFAACSYLELLVINMNAKIFSLVGIVVLLEEKRAKTTHQATHTQVFACYTCDAPFYIMKHIERPVQRTSFERASCVIAVEVCVR